MRRFVATLLVSAAAAFGQVECSNPLGLVTYRFPATASNTTQHITVPLNSDLIYVNEGSQQENQPHFFSTWIEKGFNFETVYITLRNSYL